MTSYERMERLSDSHHMRQFMRARASEPLPFGPVTQTLHPTTDKSRYETAEPCSCAFCDHLRLSEASAPIPMLYDLYEAFCVRCGMKWVGAWTEKGCSGYRSSMGPIRIYEDRASIAKPSEVMQTNLEGFL